MSCLECDPRKCGNALPCVGAVPVPGYEDEIHYKLFNIQHGNVCALCEKELDWTFCAFPDKRPVALNNHHAICKECYDKLKERYEPKKAEKK
jgi:hypothetical protein